MFRGLKPDEIDVRVGTVTVKGVTLLLYKDARCDMNILDEVYGTENWQRDHKQVKDNMFCGIGIYNDKIKQWIWKWDCGTESNTEKEKGEASDSFKRACFNLGIGRELYTGGFIFVSCATTETATGSKKYKLSNPFEFSGIKVTNVLYDESENKREIKGLEISDKNGNVIFKKGSAVKTVKTDTQADMPASEKVDTKQIISEVQAQALLQLALDTKSSVSDLCKYYEVKDLNELDMEQWLGAKKILDKRVAENKKKV